MHIIVFGLILQNDKFPHVKYNEEKIIKKFEKAISLGNIYALNNLGKIYENKKDYDCAKNYYKKAADFGDSWAQNKLGEFYRKGLIKKDLKKSFDYYTLSSESPIYTLCYWSKYNLAKYFYLNGNLEIGVKQDIRKAIELLDSAGEKIIDAYEELIYIYFDLYNNAKNKTQKEEYLFKLNQYKSKCESHKDYNNKIKNRIEKKLKDIKQSPINLPI